MRPVSTRILSSSSTAHSHSTSSSRSFNDLNEALDYPDPGARAFSGDAR